MTAALSDIQIRRLNSTKYFFRKTFDGLTAYEMAVKLNTWLMNRKHPVKTAAG
ncbi:MAG: hypothetical protein KIS86_02675 [Devosia sp.]|nr:hypothetical protein [Devosia sp.]